MGYPFGPPRATARTTTLYVCRRRPSAVNSGHCGRTAGLADGTISSSTSAPSSPMWPALARPRGRRRSGHIGPANGEKRVREGPGLFGSSERTATNTNRWIARVYPRRSFTLGLGLVASAISVMVAIVGSFSERMFVYHLIHHETASGTRERHERMRASYAR